MCVPIPPKRKRGKEKKKEKEKEKEKREIEVKSEVKREKKISGLFWNVHRREMGFLGLIRDRSQRVYGVFLNRIHRRVYPVRPIILRSA